MVNRFLSRAFALNCLMFAPIKSTQHNSILTSFIAPTSSCVNSRSFFSFSCSCSISKIVIDEWSRFGFSDTFKTFRSKHRKINIERCSGELRKFSQRGFIQWYMVVICTWCALFVTTQFDVTIWRHIHVSKLTFWRSFWHNMHILLHALPLFYVSLHWISTVSAPS